MAYKRKIQIVRGRDLSKFQLKDGEFGLERSADGLSILLYIGTEWGNKLIGADFNSEYFKELITNVAIDESVLTMIQNGIQAPAGPGLQLLTGNILRLGNPSSLTVNSTNSVTGTTHTHQIANGAINNPKLANMPASTFKGAQGAGQPQDLTIEQSRMMLNITNVPNVDCTDANNITKGYLSMDRIQYQIITEDKLHPDLLAKIGGGGIGGMESDPYVADWARKPNSKPKYTVEEIDGAISNQEFNDFKNNINNYVTGGFKPEWDGSSLSFEGTDIEIDLSSVVIGITPMAGTNQLMISKYDGSVSNIPLPTGGGQYTGSEGDEIDVIIDSNQIYAWLKPDSIDYAHLKSGLRNTLDSISRKYELPISGIPFTDLSLVVQNRLLPTGGTDGQVVKRSGTDGVVWGNATAMLSYNVTIPLNGLSGSGTTWTRAITGISQLTASSIVLMTIGSAATQAQFLEFQDVWLRVTAQASGQVTVSGTANNTTQAIPITIFYTL